MENAPPANMRFLGFGNSPPMRGRVIPAILVTGFSGIVAQILILRELLVIFYGNELSIGIILANWLILEAIGAFFVGRRAERLKEKISGFVVLQIIFSLSLFAAIYCTRIFTEIVDVVPGEGLGLLHIFLASLLIPALTSISHGALFTFSCKIYSGYNNNADATGIGKVYIYETIGTMAGGIAFTYLLIPHFHSFHIISLIAFLNLIIAIFLLGPFWRQGRYKILGSITLLFLPLTCFLIFFGGADKLHSLSVKKQWPHQEVVHYENSQYGNIAVVKRGEQYTFFTDGLPIITSPTPDIVFVEEFVHFPLLAHPYPEEILILSGGAGGLIYEVLKHPSVKRVDYTELDPLILRVVEKFPTPLTQAELTDPKVNVKYLDGRYFLKKTPHEYDVVMVGFSNPTDLQTNRLFTSEFFSLAKKRLSDEGILVVSLPSAPRADIHSRELQNLNAVILNTLKEVFPFTRIIPGESVNLFLSSTSERVSLISHASLSKELAKRGLGVGLLTPYYIEYRLQPWWLNNFKSSIEKATKRINEDFQPLGTFYSFSYWNTLFTPSMQGLFHWFERASLHYFLILAFIITITFMFLRTKIKSLTNATIPVSIFTTGFAGMIFDLALIFTFQALYGFVFHWIALLVSAFMAGVAAGSLWMTKYLERIKSDFFTFVKIEVILIIFSALLPLIFIIFSPYLVSPAVFVILKVVFLVLSLIAGFLVGVQFPLANKIYLSHSPDLSRTAGLLYGADLFGGWIGGILGGIVLLPVLGLIGTCMVVVMVKVSSLIILATSVKQPSGYFMIK